MVLHANTFSLRLSRPVAPAPAAVAKGVRHYGRALTAHSVDLLDVFASAADLSRA